MFFGRKKKNNKKDEGFRELLEKRPRLDLHPETKKTVWGIIFLTLSILIFLSFLGQAGKFGYLFARILESIFGWGKFIVPLVFLATSFIFFKSEKRNVYFSTFLGGFLFTSTILGFFEIVGKSVSGSAKHFGGIWGQFFSFPFFKLFGNIATLIIFGAIFIIAVLIFFNAPLKGIKEEKKKTVEEDEEKKKDDRENNVRGVEKSEGSIIPKIKNFFGKSKDKENSRGKDQKTEKEDEPEKFVPTATSFAKTLYKFPPVNLLSSDTDRPTSGDIKANSNIIKRTLQNFGIEVEMAEVNIGPTVTQYTLKPAEGIKLARITALQNDLALALAAHPLRMEAPIPGKSLFGIEIPNKNVATVRLRSLIDNQNFLQAASNLIFPLGRDVSGVPVYADLKKMPHLLVAGSTGSGKTVALNCFIVSLLYRNSPEMLRMILIDPKRVEFPIYNDAPHLLTPVITEGNKTVLALKWLVREMEKRFDILVSVKARDITAFNIQAQNKKDMDIMPYIVVIIDELADLMAARGKEVEGGIVRLAQMARAVGIHLIVATQRPSVEVITGLIKANITSRVSFQVASQVDSRTIIDMSGAEKLLGSGDMLFLSAEVSKPRRIQGAFISDKEVRKIMDWIRNSNEGAEFQGSEEILSQTEEPQSEFSKNGNFINFDGIPVDDATEDNLYKEAKKLVIQARKASASYLQRRLSVGYARAARLIDMLEERGVVGPGEGAKPREVYAQESETDDMNDANGENNLHYS